MQIITERLSFFVYGYTTIYFVVIRYIFFFLFWCNDKKLLEGWCFVYKFPFFPIVVRAYKYVGPGSVRMKMEKANKLFRGKSFD